MVFKPGFAFVAFFFLGLTQYPGVNILFYGSERQILYVFRFKNAVFYGICFLVFILGVYMVLFGFGFGFGVVSGCFVLLGCFDLGRCFC